MDKAKIIQVAEETRKWAELYGRRKSYPKDLCGVCAIATVKLHLNLKKAGLDSTLNIAQDDFSAHCFVVCNGFIVDVTATQFWHTRIVVTPERNERNVKWYWTSLEEYDNAVDFIKGLEGMGFVGQQVPHRNMLKMKVAA